MQPGESIRPTHREHLSVRQGQPPGTVLDVTLLDKAPKLAPERCAMVGDSRHDVEAARGAGMPVAGLRGGYGSAEEFELHPPDVLIDTLAELPAWLSRITIAA